MTRYIPVRPLLLNEMDIRSAIFETGLCTEDKEQIVALLVESFAIDFDLLESVFATLQDFAESEAELLQAA